MLDPSSSTISIASKKNNSEKYFDVLGGNFEICTMEF
jgi:hypothetical protein